MDGSKESMGSVDGNYGTQLRLYPYLEKYPVPLPGKQGEMGSAQQSDLHTYTLANLDNHDGQVRLHGNRLARRIINSSISIYPTTFCMHEIYIFRVK